MTTNLHSLLGSGQKEKVRAFNTKSGFNDGISMVDKGRIEGFCGYLVKYRDVVDASILSNVPFYVFQNSLEDEPEKISYESVYT